MKLLARLFGKQPARTPQIKLKPRPDLRDRRFATWDMDRRQRYLDAAYGEPQSLRGRA